jgi:hypothetical protein
MTAKQKAERDNVRQDNIQDNLIIRHSSRDCKLYPEKITFAGQKLIAATFNNQHFVAMKPLVEALGLDWGGQAKKLQQDNKFNCRLISIVAEDGRQRDMLFIPLRKLNGWLFSINVKRCRTDVQERLRFYQDECFAALYDYFHKGYAVNPQASAPQLESLVEHVEKLQFQLGYQKHRLELFDSVVECGAISKTTGNARIVPVRGTYRSLPRKGKKKKHSKSKQLSFLQALFQR